MPNWCECDLIVSGPVKELEKFKEQVTSGNEQDTDEQKVFNRIAGIKKELNYFDANKIIPYPEEYRLADETARLWKTQRNPCDWDNCPADGYNHGGYEWCITNWGTKWGLCDVTREERPRSVFYFFQCAWSPPVPVIMQASRMFPRLKFTLRYYEQGMGFSGKLVLKGGKTLTDDYNDNYRGGRGG